MLFVYICLVVRYSSRLIETDLTTFDIRLAMYLYGKLQYTHIYIISSYLIDTITLNALRIFLYQTKTENHQKTLYCITVQRANRELFIYVDENEE